MEKKVKKKKYDIMELITDIEIKDGLTSLDSFRMNNFKVFPRIVKGEYLTGDFLRTFLFKPILGGEELYKKMELIEVTACSLTAESVPIYNGDEIVDSYFQEYRSVPKQKLTLVVFKFNGA